MNEEKYEPVLPSIVKDWKNRRLIKKKKEIDELKLEIEKAKLKRELNEIKTYKK